MKRKLLLTAALLTVAGFALAKENLAILPFTGGQGAEGETIAELFSFEPRLDEVFSLIPRTSISRAISNERGFQMGSGMTDPDTVVSIANEVGARYVVAGSVTSVGNNNLLVISILDIRNLQQIAGDYQTYPRGRIENLRGRLPGMAENIIRATLSNTAALPKLAIVPVQLQGDTDRRVADTLAQLLAIHLIRSGRYAVFPRAGSLEQVQAEHDAQMSGHTADKNIIGIGHGENPDYVLSVVARRLGSVNMFNAVIVNLLTRVQAVGRSVDYQDIDDGMRAMETLSVALTSSTEQISQQRQEREEAERIQQKREKRIAFFGYPAKFWSLGVSAGTSFATPLVIGTARGTLASWRYTFFDIGLDAGFITQTEGVGYWSLYPFVHYAVFVPFAKSGGWYIGAGGGFMIGEYTFDGLKFPRSTFAADFTTGFLFFDFLGIAYTLRTNFFSASNKLSVGYVYRFKYQMRSEQ